EGYHFVNIALHIACALALYGAMRLLLARVEEMAPRAGALALASALLWSLHPLNSQVVNYITQRSESLMALCYLGTLYCIQRRGTGGAGSWSAGAVLCCGLGMARYWRAGKASNSFISSMHAAYRPICCLAWRNVLCLAVCCGWTSPAKNTRKC
ncbi:MAG: hypothetical protein CFH38_00373, partial [Alphaproteobacteria bacterium MarineAlpha10_Bin1]